MKNLIIVLFVLYHFNSVSQITGKVLYDNNEPVEFGTIFNLNAKSSSITNIHGQFEIEGNVGDSIRIQHVNCISREFRVYVLDSNYVLQQKNIQIDEIKVTAKYAINIFKRSCINTFNTFKHNNTYKAYFQYLGTINEDTIQIIDIDLDMVQKKLKNIDKGEKLIPYKVQERNKFKPSTPFCQTKPFFTYINQIYNWANYLENSNYFKIEDSFYFKLYFIGNRQKIEVIIQKKDTCLVSVRGTTSISLSEKNGEEHLKINKSYFYVKYAYEDKIGYLSEMSVILTIPNPANESEILTFKQFFKTYDYKTDNMSRRPNGHRIFDNLWEPRLIKNNYEEIFWKRIYYDSNFDKELKNFENIHTEKDQGEESIKKSNSSAIRGFGLGIHKDKE